jgi:hypothetical protein
MADDVERVIFIATLSSRSHLVTGWAARSKRRIDRRGEAALALSVTCPVLPGRRCRVLQLWSTG